jgi:hypothetical protein
LAWPSAPTVIEARIDSIVMFFSGRIGMAQMAGDQRLIERFGWLIDALQRLNQGERMVPMDG